MKRTRFIIMLVLAVIFTVNLNAQDRDIGCNIISNTNYTPGEDNLLNFDITITGAGYDKADYVKLTFPTGMVPASATPLGGETGRINGQRVEWGQMAGWTGSGNGNIYTGTYNVSVSVDVDIAASGDQSISFEVQGDDPHEMDIASGHVIVSQLAVGPIISLDKTQLVFDPLLIGTSNTQIINITNIGIGDLSISNIANSNEEVFAISDYSSAIAQNNTLALEVIFTPVAFDLYNTTLTITSNGGVDREIALQGIGITDYNVVESFEGVFPPIGWVNTDGVWSQSTNLPYSGQYSAICGGSLNDNKYLITPKLDIKATDRVIFHAANGYNNAGGMELAISTNATDWTTLSTTNFHGIYTAINVDLSAFVGSYYLGFKRISDRYTHIDQIILPEFDTANQEPLPIVLLNPANEATDLERDVVLEWNVDPFADGYYLSLGTNVDADNILASYDLGDATSYTPETLDWDTTYFWNVVGYNDNGESTVDSNWSFTTEVNSTITPPYTELFDTFPPLFWTRAKGILSEDVDFESTTNSAWAADGFCNDGSTGAARLNIYGSNRMEWLISPTIDLADNEYEISFDLGLTPWSGQAAAVLGSDDIFAVLISTDNGESWSSSNTLREWRAGDDISNTGENIVISLEEYSGLVKVAFYGESTVPNVDVNVYVDNFKVLPAGTETPILGTSVAELIFSDLPVGDSSENKIITLSNTGSGFLRVTDISLSDEVNFQLTDSNDYPVELSTNTLDVEVKFTPQTAAEHSANLLITTDLGVTEVPLTGLGYEPLPGDLVENAIVIELDADGNYSDTGTTYGFYDNYDLPGNDGKDVVYLLTLDNVAVVDFSLLNSDFNTKLAIYADDVIPASNNYLFYNDDYSNDVVQSALYDISLEAGSYYVVIDANGTAAGTYVLDIEATIQTVEASVVITPLTHDYTEIVVGNNSEIMNFTITNNGETAFVINSATINGDNFELFFNGSLPLEITDNSYTLGARFIPVDLGNITEEIIISTNAGDYNIELTGFAFDQNVYHEGFENEIFPPHGWVRFDNDGDGQQWRPWSGTYARSGEKFMMSNTASMWGDVYHPDNWIVSPQVTVRENDTMLYYVRPMNPEVIGDSYAIKVSTTHNSSIAAFSTTLFTEETTSEIWARREIDLSAYVGQDIYLAFHHFENNNDSYAFGIDDIFLPPLTVNNPPTETTYIYPKYDTEYIYGTTALYWNRVVTADNYILNLGTNNPPSNIYAGEELGNVDSKVLTDLEPNTTYYWQVIPANSEGQAPSYPLWTFTTTDFSNLTAPHRDNFDNYNSMPFFPHGWTEFKGLFDQNENNRIVNTFLGWGMGRFGNQEGNNRALAIEYSTTNSDYWAVSPIIDLGDDPDTENEIRFDLALTKITTTEQGYFGFDDKLMLLISQDGGATWNEESIVKTWNSNDFISNTGQTESIMLTGYSGEVVLAFYAESTFPTPSCKLFIDNLYIGEQATEPVLNTFPEHQHFPMTQVTTMSQRKTFRVNNVGVGSLNIESVTLEGESADQFVIIDNNTYPIGLTDNQLEFGVIFRPTSAGAKTAHVAITTADLVHELELDGYAFGTEGNTIDDPVLVEFVNGEYTTYGNTEMFDDNYTLPYDYVPDDANDVVYKFSLEEDMIVHAAISEIDWDSKIAVYSASVYPDAYNYLYYNDDSEDMGIRRSGERTPTRGFESVLMFMELPAGDYFLIVDGSTKTEWYEPYGEYRLDMAAYNFVAPTNLEAEVVASTVSLTWDAPTGGNGTLYGYTVKRDGFAINSNIITGTSYTDNTALEGYEYRYQVVAYYENPTGFSGLSNSVVVSFGEHSDIVFEDSFEEYRDFSIEFEPWTLHNLDGAVNYGIQGYDWYNMAEPYAFIIFNPLTVTPPIEFPEFTPPHGDKYVAHFASESVVNNDWLITPQLALGSKSSVSFLAKSFTHEYGTDNFKFMISTSGNEPRDFRELAPTSNEGEVIPTEWKKYIYSLEDYDNQDVYLAIHVMSPEGFLMMLDDFTVRSNDGVVPNEGGVEPVLATELYGNYPNPFNPETTVSFNLKNSGNVKLEIYNLKGQRVKTLINDKLEAGKHNVVWNGTNNNNNPAASGVYFFRMQADNRILIHKSILMK